jgi:hypothetical protein
MVAKILTKAAQEAKDIWDSYNKKGGKNYNKKFEDDKPRGTTPTPENKRKQEKKLISEKAKLRKKDPEKYRDVTKSGLTRKKIKPEQGNYEPGDFRLKPKKTDPKLEKRLSEGRQKYGKKMDKASRGEGSYKDGGTPKKSLKQKIKELKNKNLTPKEEAELKRLTRLPSSGVKEDTPPKPRSKPNMNKGGLVLKVLKKGVVRGSYS